MADKEEGFTPVTKLLLARLKSHPEEFNGDEATRLCINGNGILGVLNRTLPFVPQEEQAALQEALKEAQLHNLYGEAVKLLTQDKEAVRGVGGFVGAVGSNWPVTSMTIAAGLPVGAIKHGNGETWTRIS